MALSKAFYGIILAFLKIPHFKDECMKKIKKIKKYKKVFAKNPQYRPNVCAIVLSSDKKKNRFFIAHRCDLAGVWQLPQGGIDKNESPKKALLRELSEEIGTRKVKILGKCPKWLKYDFPPGMPEKFYRGYRGQIQRYFLVRLRDDTKINIATKKPEFDKFEFVDRFTLLNRATSFKKDLYIYALDYFTSKGLLK